MRRLFAAADDGSNRLVALGFSLVVIWLVFHAITDGLFLTPRNFYNLAVQSSTVAVLTIGMTMVIITRNIERGGSENLNNRDEWFFGATAA